jgi:predicted RNA binding protein YcfA (HicA-like mRNA interferase family)
VVVKEEPTRTVTKRLRKAGFSPTDAAGSHTKWTHQMGPSVSIPDGHRTISPGVVRQVNNAIAEAERLAKEGNEAKEGK